MFGKAHCSSFREFPRTAGILDDGSDRLGLRRNQQSDEIRGNIPALPLGDARISQHAAANGAHAMSKLEGAPMTLSRKTARRSAPAMRAALVRPTYGKTCVSSRFGAG